MSKQTLLSTFNISQDKPTDKLPQPFTLRLATTVVLGQNPY